MSQLKLVWDRTDPDNKQRAKKLTGDKYKILTLLKNGQVWTVSAIAQAIGNKAEPSVSANVRNLRKDGFKIKLVKFGHGLNGYILEGK